MKFRLLTRLLLSLLPLVCTAQAPVDGRLAAISMLLTVPVDYTSERWQAAAQVVFKYVETEMPKLNMPDEAMAWVPQTGPCASGETLLMLAFLASIMKDRLTDQVDGTIYRAWGTVIQHYRYLRNMPPDPEYPESKFPAIPTIEAMIKRDAEGTLKAEAAKLEMKWKSSVPASPSR